MAAAPTPPNTAERDDLSIFFLANTILHGGWRVLLAGVIGGALAVLPTLRKPDTFTAKATIVAQGSDGGQSALAGLAGQFGVSIGRSGQTPQFYIDLLKSRSILGAIARDTIRVGGAGPALTTDVLRIKSADPIQKTEAGIGTIGGMVNGKVAPQTGVITVTATTRSRDLSLAILRSALVNLNRFNVEMRQTQAREEAGSMARSLGEARVSLRDAEDRMQDFLARNRSLGSSPQLTFERERLEREVQLRQQVVSALSQQAEDMRIRQLRDTPVLIVIDEPSAPLLPDPRGRRNRILLGAVLGMFVASLVLIAAEMTRRRAPGANPELDLFLQRFARFRPRRRHS